METFNQRFNCMRLFTYFLMLSAGSVCAETRSIVPRASGEGSIGTPSKPWGTGVFNKILANSVDLTSNSVIGGVTINGVSSNVFTFVGQYPIVVSNIGNTIYCGYGAVGGGTFIPAAASNQVFNYVSDTNQLFTVPAGVTQLYVYAWGGGGGGGWSPAYTPAGGPSGYSFGYFIATPGEILTVFIGEGGSQSETTSATTVTSESDSAFPDGGKGASKYQARAGGGGGSTSIWRGTNILVLAAGGGGGGAVNCAGGGGGGDSGQAGYTSGGIGNAGGGTQSAGGSTATTAIPLVVTNSSGSYFLGGNGGLTTNLLSMASGGGGGGVNGGAGGLAGTSNNGGGGGGGGAGFINISQGVVGTTVRGQTSGASTVVAQPPPGIDDPLSGSPSSVPWGYNGANSLGRHGGLIIRWVQP